jgi:hypothetical protein
MLTFDELAKKLRRAHTIPLAVARAALLVALFPSLEFHDISSTFRGWPKLRRVLSAIVWDVDFIAFRSLIDGD